MAQETLPPKPTIRVSVDIVELDVSVAASDRKAVRGLGPTDFVVLQDGTPQPIISVSFVDRPATATAGLPPLLGSLRREDVTRVIVIVVDDLNLSHISLSNVRQGLRKFVETGVAPGVAIGIVRTSSGAGTLQTFTADRRQLLAVVESLRWNPRASGGSDEPRSTINQSDTRQVGSPHAEEELAQLVRDVRAIGSLAVLEWAMLGLQAVPGRKSVVLVSDGIPLTVRTPFGLKGNRLLGRFQGLVANAHRAGVVFHAIHPGGLMVEHSLAATGEENALAYLPARTGGRFLSDRNFLERDLANIMESDTGFYMIAYRPPEGSFDGKGHKIEVKLRRPRKNWTVQSRRELIAVDTATPSSPVAPIAGLRHQLAKALLSPFGAVGIPLRLTALQMTDSSGKSLVRCLLHVEADSVDQTPGSGGEYRTGLEVMVVGVDSEGKINAFHEGRFDSRFEGGQLRALAESGLTYGIEYNVDRPGPYQMRIAVRDTASGRIGSASQFLVIPDRASGRIGLSSLILDPFGNPALRRYRAGTTVAYALQLYNPARGVARKARFFSQVRLYRDSILVHQGHQDPLELPPNIGPAEVAQLSGTLSLGEHMSAGHYLVEFRLTMEIGSRTESWSEWQDFTVD